MNRRRDARVLVGVVAALIPGFALSGVTSGETGAPGITRGDAIYLGPAASVRQTMLAARVHGVRQSGKRLRAYRLRGVSPELALAVVESRFRPKALYVRTETLTTLPAHPLHRVLFPRSSPPPVPTGCGKTEGTITGRVMDVGSGGTDLGVRTQTASAFLDQRRGTRASLLVVRSTKAWVRLRWGAPSVRRGEHVKARVSRCNGDGLVVRELSVAR